MRRALLVLPLLLAGCGASHHAAVTVHAYGTGATRSWVFEPAGRPKLVVLFIHGLGGQRETTPYFHRPWLEHMAREGWEVVYPAYEAHPLQNGAMRHLLQGLAIASHHVAHGIPVAAIGYSRGGRLVVDYAAVSRFTGLVPRRIFSVFPAGTMDEALDLEPLDGRTKLLVVTGDWDQVVGNVGANELAAQLAAAGFPPHDATFQLVRSHGFFVADHTSVLENSVGARRAFWERADRFFAPLAAS